MFAMVNLAIFLLLSSLIELTSSKNTRISRIKNKRMNKLKNKRNNNAIQIAESDMQMEINEPTSQEIIAGNNGYNSKIVLNDTLTVLNFTDTLKGDEESSKYYYSNEIAVTNDVIETKCKTALDLSLHLGTCLESHQSTGCSDETCENVICNEINDELCCTSQWDDTCASEAKIICIKDLLPKSSCYYYSDRYAGCDNEECQSLVCGVDERCCEDVWSWDCVNKAVDYCCLDSFE